jgi:hypothetical protein
MLAYMQDFCKFRPNKNLQMKPYLKYGLMAAAVSIILGAIVSYGELDNRMLTLVINILCYTAVAMAIFMALRYKRAAQNDYLSFGQGFGEGMRVAIVAGIATSLWHYIDAKFLHHDLTETMYAKMQEQLESKNLSDQEMEMATKWGKQMITPGGQAIMVFLGSLILGLVLSLVIAAVLRNEDASSQHNNPMYSPESNNPPQV